MSHLGMQILYDMFNRRPDVWCERVYSPWTDLTKIMLEKKIPLFALESQDKIVNFDFLGITLQYELCYTNILQILELSGIPLHAQDRGLDRPLRTHAEDYPIVIGGGPCAFNPEPIAKFFDLFYIGEGEVSYDELMDLYKQCRKEGVTRREFLRRATSIPGIYCPLFYDVTYKEDGTIASFTPNTEGVPKRVRKVIVKDIDSVPYPEKPLVPFMKITQDRVTLEVMRGCIRGCRFCQAGMIYRPTRPKNEAHLEALAEKMLSSSGQGEISLSSLSTSDYPDLEGLIGCLIENYGKKYVNISLPSLRIDAFSLGVMEKVQDVRKSSLTFAPEAGSQRLRNVINKGLTEDDILRGAAQAFCGGWNRVKLYFMLGLPTETEEDRKAIAHLAEKITEVYYEIPKERRFGRCQVNVSTAFFVPKPFTPFQWAQMSDPGDYLGFAATVNHEIREMLNGKSIRYSWHEAYVTVLEGLLARGDRRVAGVIERAYRTGCLFDAWSEQWDWSKWEQAMADEGIDLAFYTKRERHEDEIFPWDFIDIGVTKQFLLREWSRAHEAEVTLNCQQQCNNCGAGKYGCGVCMQGEEYRGKTGEPFVPAHGKAYGVKDPGRYEYESRIPEKPYRLRDGSRRIGPDGQECPSYDPETGTDFLLMDPDWMKEMLDRRSRESLAREEMVRKTVAGNALAKKKEVSK